MIDAHSHYIPQEIARNTSFFKVHWSDIRQQLKIMDEAGIEKSLLLYPTTDADEKMGDSVKVCSIYNQEIAKVTKKYKDRFIGAAILPVSPYFNPSALGARQTGPACRPARQERGEEKAMLKELARLRDLNLEAISLPSSCKGRFLDEEIFHPIYSEAQTLNLPIFIHSQIINPIGFERVGDPLLMPVVEYLFDITMCLGKMMMSGIFARFPGVKFVFAHFAGVTPFLKDRFDTTYAMLRQRGFVKDLGKAPSEILSNVYVDTSGVGSVSLLNLALEFFSKDRLLWGSDYPANRKIADSIQAVKNLNIKEEDKQKILGGNINSLF